MTVADYSSAACPEECHGCKHEQECEVALEIGIYAPEVKQSTEDKLNGWISVKDRLPDIAEDEKASEDVIAGCWFEDDLLREDSPKRFRFVWGPCFVINDSTFPQGKRWITFGPSHNMITHWRPALLPPERQNCG